jgi:predicted AlkP superfamily pyrophosphatase or phosphodiesterase
MAAGSDASPPDAAPIVIVLSWDGVRHDYLDWAQLPALTRVERDGVRAERLIPPFPSLTFPSHVTLATGTYPDRHGILANNFWDGERRFRYSNDANWLEAEPLWVAAERQGVPSAVFFWVGSETDWHGRGARYRKSPFDPEIGEAEKVDQLLAWLDLPEAERPRLLMGWWHGTDHVGHRRGPHRADIVEQLATQDAQLLRLLQGLDERGLWARTTLLIVSDHGMALATRKLDPGTALGAAGIEARVTRAGGAAFVYLADTAKLELARAALETLDDASVYARDEIPERLRVRHARRTGDLLLVAHPPAMFARVSATDSALLSVARLFGRGAGMHGYEPDNPDMGGIFLASGRGVPAGARLGPVRAIDVAPTVAALLGIEPPAQAEGRTVLGAAAE